MRHNYDQWRRVHEQSTFVWLQSYHVHDQSGFRRSLELSICVYDYPLSSFLALRNRWWTPLWSPPIIRLEGVPAKIRDLFDEFEKEIPASICSSLIKGLHPWAVCVLFIKRSSKPKAGTRTDCSWMAGGPYIGSHLPRHYGREAWLSVFLPTLR